MEMASLYTLLILLLALLLSTAAETLTTEKLLEYISNIPPEFGYLDTNLYFYLLRKKDPASFPYPDFTTGYEEESVTLQITFAETESDSVAGNRLLSHDLNLPGAEWVSRDVVVVPSSALTWANIVENEQQQVQAQSTASNVLYITRYIPPTTNRADNPSPALHYIPPTLNKVGNPAPALGANATFAEQEGFGQHGRMLTVALAPQAQGLFRTLLSQYMAQSGMTGAGVTIGVLSDSVNAVNMNTGNTADLNTLISQGIVTNPVTVVSDSNLASDTNEGAAMINIVADMCPGCTILFATANGGEAAFAASIRQLAALGAQVIVDDITYRTEEVFQEGVVEQAVSDVTQAGVLYFSSAANNGNVASGSRATFLGQFNPVASPGAQSEQNFAANVVGNPFVVTAPVAPATTRNIVFNLHWSTPSNTGNPIAIRMGLFIEDAAGTVLFQSTPGLAVTRPNVVLPTALAGGNFRARVIVPNGGGAFPADVVAADQRIFLLMQRSSATASFQVFTQGASFGHNAPFQGFGVAAVDTNLLTTPFTNANVVERFSSDGQTPRCFLRSGVYIGCANKLQPSVAGPDGVSTSVVEFNPFFGTSAAAPAVAAMVAVFKQRFGAFLTPQVLQIALQSGRATLDIMDANYDVASGWGILMAPLLNQELLRQQALANCIPNNPLLSGYGCNGLDDDCNGVVDECAEDIFPPQFITSEYSFPRCFNNRALVAAFFTANTLVQDECRGASTLLPVNAATDIAARCDTSTVTLSAVDACGNTATNTVMFPFDNAAPTVTVDAAKIPGVCFTSQAVTENALLQVTTVADDCTTDPNNIVVSISSFDKNCAASTATIKAVDLCDNVQTLNVPLNFDDRPPVITIDAAAINTACLTSQEAAEALILEKTAVTDNCTPANDIVKSIVHFEENCGFSRAVVEAIDKCGNRATEEVRFNFDDQPPSLLVSEYALGAKWFTQAAYASNFFLTNTFSQDDCRPQADIVTTFTNLVKNCAATTATITVKDVCGNVASSAIMFPYDDVAPALTLSVAKDKLEDTGKKKEGLVDVGLSITATDVCTPNPNVTLRVYSDELYLKDADSWTARTAQLSRVEATPGIVTGWRLLVAAEAFSKCNVGPYACGGTTPGAGNGRVYTIVACATDEAGLRTCTEVTVAVTPTGWKVSAAPNDGKNYLLAKDDVNKLGTI